MFRATASLSPVVNVPEVIYCMLIHPAAQVFAGGDVLLITCTNTKASRDHYSLG